MNYQRVLQNWVSALTFAAVFGGNSLQAELRPLPTNSASEATWSTAGDGTFENQIYSSTATGKAKARKPYVITLGMLRHPSYVVTGKVVIPGGSGIRIMFEPPAVPAADPKANAPAGPKGPVPVVVVRDAQGTALKNGRATLDGGPLDASMPLMIFVRDDTIEIQLGTIHEVRIKTEAPFELSLGLSGAAQLSNLKVAALETGGNVPLPSLEQRTNTTTEGKDAAVGRFAAGAVPSGFVENAGVVFYIPEGHAVDIGTSMTGLADPFRKKSKFYMSSSTKTQGRTVLDIAGDQYSALHLLAFSAGRSDHVGRMTVRVGHYGGASAILEDVVVEAPGFSGGKTNAMVVGEIPVKLADGRVGTLSHLRVPMSQTGNVKEFGRFDLEFTRDMNTHLIPPDPNEFGKAPLGMPSDVVILGATMEPSPITMTYETAEAGNVFQETQKAEFTLTLVNRSAQPQSVRAFARSEGPGTGEELGVERRAWTVETKIQLRPSETKKLTLDASPGKRGWFTCQIGVEAAGRLVQRRDTTFAVLAPDTRKAMKDSPFGIWEFWSPHSVRPLPDQIERLAKLMNKGGWRYTYGGSPVSRRTGDAESDIYTRLREQYKIHFTVANLPNSYQRGTGWWNEAEFNQIMPDALEKGLKNSDGHFKVLHESRSSTSLIRRYSDFLGGTAYDMPAEETAKLNEQFENVKKFTAAIKKLNPAARIVMVNDYPAVAIEYLKRGFPAGNFDVIGLEGAMFLRSPERQPDWLSLLGHQHEIRRAMKKYGYDKPIWTTEALYHPTEDGALTLHQQATIAVREAMMALQLGVQRMAAAGLIKDPSDDYHWSNWGSAGYCYRDPEINPKPAYAAYAWLTQVLDQARPNGKLQTPNRSLHLVDFKKPDGSHVYALWTANGQQAVTLKIAPGGKPQVFDFYGNSIKTSGPLTLQASPTPYYITGAMVAGVESARPVEVPDGNAGKLVLDFDKPDQIKPLTQRNPVLESHWETPRIKGEFASSFVTEDGATAMKVELQPDEDPRKLLPRYGEFELARPITLDGRPHEFVFRVKGNSGWGRILFELTDAKGRVWTSTGNQYAGASNSADPHGQSFVNFSGWKTMRFPIVGMYPGVDQTVFWPRNYNWWPFPSPEAEALAAEQAAPKVAADTRQKTPVYQGIVPVAYPLTLRKIIVTFRPHILYLDEEVPMENQVIYIDSIGVTQPPEGM
jgi:hypothetical protein